MTEIEETLAQESGSFRELFRRALRIPLLIGVILPFFSQISGINVIIYYGESVFKKAGLGEDPRLLSQIVFGSITVLATVGAMLVVDKLGRKPLLLVGIAGVGLSLLLAGGLFFSISPVWLLVVFAAFLACFNFSYGPICWIIISEVFPTKVRGRAMSISTFSLWTGCALVTITFPKLLDSLGPMHTFWLYALSTPIAFLFVWLIVPETKGRTLEQIERQFQ
jgi:MFS family permease